MRFSFKDISEVPNDCHLPEIDRQNIDESKLTEDQKFYKANGYLILKGFIPDDLNNAYQEIRKTVSIPVGFPDCTPYMRHKEIRNLGLYPPLMQKLEELIGFDMGMHLNLTGWVSTERNFHQDDYLNPPFVLTHYAAVWIALDDIHEDSGPFEYVPGSHKWPLIRKHLLFNHYPKELESDPAWPRITQNEVAKACEQEIKERNAEKKQFIAKRNDVLIWHARLLHRGTEPKDKSLLRKSFISHYSSIHHRQDMPKALEHTKGCYYFPLNGGPV